MNIFNWKDGIPADILELDEGGCFKLDEDKHKFMYFRLCMIDYENEEYDCCEEYLLKVRGLDAEYKKEAIDFLIGDSLAMDG